jgi:hypothetical protein
MKGVVKYLKGDEEPEYDESIVSQQKAGTLNLFGGPSDDQDPLFEEAKQLIVTSGKASSSLLQRRLKVGYSRGARIMDELEEAGVIGPGSGAKAREVLMTKDELHGTIVSTAKHTVFDAPHTVTTVEDDDNEDTDELEKDKDEENKTDEPVEEELDDFNDSIKPEEE